jgi:glycosyltransferase involved in cell wall biosynthesis
MKIVHVIPNLLKGGAERLCIDICNELSTKEGVEIKLVVLSEENLYPELTENIDIVYCPVTFNLSLSKKNKIDISSYTNFIDLYQPDVVHSHLYRAELISREKTNKNTRYFSHLHDNMPQLLKGGGGTILRKEKITNFFERTRLLKKYAKCNNQFISISRDTTSYFKHNLPENLRNITLIQNAINLSQFLRPNNWIKKNDEKLKLVSIGSLVNKKNHLFLIEIVEELIEKGLNPQLSILGEGPNRTRLETEIEDRKLKEHIHLKGNVSRVEEFLWDADIYVHSASYEPFGLVLLEAMAAGIPCVSIDGGGNRDIIINEENGFIIKKGNTALFTEAIVRLSTDDSFYNNIVTNGLKHVQDFGIKEYVDKLISCYKG